MTGSPRILILTFYYPPDVQPGSFRASAVVDQLRRQAGAQARIEVVTAMPNRYASYRTDAPEEETDGPVRVRRVPVPAHQSGMADHIRSYGTFALGAMRLVRGERYDVVFATSARLFTGFLASLVSRGKRVPLYLDIRDIFAEVMQGMLPGWIARPLAPVLDLIERATIARASGVNLVSPGFSTYFQRRYPTRSFEVVPNGVDSDFLENRFDKPDRADGDPVRIVYAGNIGYGQGLDRILPELAQALAGRAEIHVIGDGGMRAALQERLAEAGVGNVHLRAPVPRHELVREYARADVLFLHLNTDPAFERVLPSKMFEYAATGKPILAGVPGVAARFLREEVADNVAVFPPCDAQAALDGVAALRLEPTDRSNFVARYRRDVLMRDLAARVLAVARR